jgi:nucleoside-diphosphate-sugar epimerase
LKRGFDSPRPLNRHEPDLNDSPGPAWVHRLDTGLEEVEAMRVFIAGSTGVLGRRLVPMLLSGGHKVTGTTRSGPRAAELRSAGAEPVVVDALNRADMQAAVRAARPQVIVHELTALRGKTDIRTIERGFELTNRLRTDGTEILLSAAHEAGVHRFVAQSFAGWPNERIDGPIKTEDDPLDRDPPPPLRDAMDAIEHLERAVTHARDLDGIVLRYGTFYGPGTTLSEGGEHLEQIRHRRFPLVGEGNASGRSCTSTTPPRPRWTRSNAAPGIYNVVDDEPARVAEWLPALADAIGAKPPRHAPVWLARLVSGEAGVALMTSIRGSSNAKAQRELGWQPRYPSWRSGFRLGLGTVSERAA